jgi:alkyl hydroperoxide reductase subunit D
MNTLNTNETIQGLLQDLGIDASYTSPSLTALAAVNSKYLKDLKLNVSGSINSRNLLRKQTLLIALSVAVNEKHGVLIAAFERLAIAEGATPEEIGETHTCASMMSLNNIFYRFKHYMHGVEFYNKQPAGLRMSAMMGPTMGKATFELMSTVLSAVNGCERCVVAHEHSVKEHNITEVQMYDAIRLGAVIKSLCIAF